MLPQSFIDQVKEATDMVQLAKKYTELKLIGDGIWQGTCPHPDHKDSTPSFRVWEKDQSWACMGCHYGKKDTKDKNYGSDCFAFLQWMEKINWKQSILKLAEEADIPVPSDENTKLYKRKKILAESYTKSRQGQVFNYLLSRGLNKKDMEYWCIGFDGLRITFPLFDRYKNILGFTKRIFLEDPEIEPKYKNSSTSKIFNKSFYLYGAHLMDNEFGEIRITEGPLDVIVPNKYGVKNIVATLGTAVTDGHVELIKKYNKTPVFCMDGDPAGLQSINKAINKLADEGIYSKVLVLPNGIDMADLANTLKEDTEQYIQDNAVTYGQFKIQDIINQYDAKVNEIKLKLYPEVLKLLKEIPYELERDLIKDYVEEKMQIKIAKEQRR